jgi:chemotaxis protein MotB
MYKNDKNIDESNFWISYADLMAGLLFVFILVVGAIVVKYMFVQQDLKQKEQVLDETKNRLQSKDEKVKLFKDRLKSVANRLKEEQMNRDALASSLNQKDKRLSDLKDDLKLKLGEISKLKDLLLEYDLNNSKLEENLTKIEQKLAKDENILILKDKEIEALGAKLLENAKEHQMLVEELNITKVKIKNLTGIRIKVIKKLRDELGSSINIDPKSGAIRFSSNILFNQGEYKLKPKAKKELSSTIKKYITTLLSNDKIRGYIDNITIEGHTDTDGTYLYNLALSQKRALEVMKFIYKDDPQNEELYKRYLSASGRSYSDLILDENGKEDKEASRRIEIKFRIKNEEAVKELERFLNRK